MKLKEFIVKAIVILTLISYIICSGVILGMALKKQVLDNALLMHINNVLSGFVGSIFAITFGVKTTEKAFKNRLYAKLQNTGSTISENNTLIFGLFYSISYIIVGLSSIIISVYLNKNNPENIATMAATSFGLLIAIATSFFRNH
ncbi:MAG: hypothetical protein K1X55_11055 [Chitinophagales bacterium]|nr:hypothetical protein [Chitinophagales bacterium]